MGLLCSLGLNRELDISTTVDEPVLQLFRQDPRLGPFIAAKDWANVKIERQKIDLKMYLDHLIPSVFAELGCPMSQANKSTISFDRCPASELPPKLGKGLCGMKVMYDQVPGDEGESPIELLKWAAFNNIKVVHFIRSSHIRRVISMRRSSQVGVHHVRKSDVSPVWPAPQSLELDVNLLSHDTLLGIRNTEKYRSLISALVPAQLSHELLYEDLIDPAQSNRQFSGLVNFLLVGNSLPHQTRFMVPSSDEIRGPQVPCHLAVRNWSAVITNLRVLSTRRQLPGNEVRALQYSLDDCL